MNRLKQKTIAGWVESKSRMMQLLEAEREPQQRQDYAKAVNFCDKKIAQIKGRQRELLKRFLVWLLVSAVIFVTGCNTVREGVYGAGRCIGAVGEDIQWMAEKLGDNVSVQEK